MPRSLTSRPSAPRAGLSGPAEAEFPFVDLASKARWTLRFNDGRIALVGVRQGAPGAGNERSAIICRWRGSPGNGADKPIGEVINCSGPLYQRLLEPLLLAALNIEPREGSAKLAAALIRETLALGGQACRPLLARDGIGNVFVEPAIAYLKQNGVSIAFQDELVALHFSGGAYRAARICRAPRRLGNDDAVILAVPPYVATNLVPDLPVPTSFRGIVNAHFRVDPPASHAADARRHQRHRANGYFRFPGRISVTISSADRLFEMPREELAQTIWSEVAAVAGLPDDAAALADRARAPRHFRRNARAERAAPAARNVVAIIFSSPATGPRPACRRRSKARSARATAPPTLLRKPCGPPHDDLAFADTPRGAGASASLGPAIEARDARLLGLQRDDGHWVFELEADCTIPAEYVLLRHYRGEPVDAALEQKIAIYLRRIQGAHGGWPLFHDGDFDMSASVKAYFALKMIGDSI